ncbi:undecaprenyldiphospho-muramoylpentapeptide beta-N-acetylglucosaminyltransferase [Rhodovibrio salinarum]|uniref:UDP-N-acetylglucosamine--N-acetylmuramyl-(pentapeptide) pyrophosphoryl-undecaprenol N-acetylglucosamine transferase n=1 Tax=Rhodovibrio salinarum TaxID=1087 RepID=A0A934QH84_9PROT|nr:undecaprenyldiphospho-muramoylpentapeptide beta-N-acetylglucosaminyltransferase [Rhodovibrio salinarum]MBK1696500.1 undecaprenyldiphospho-muramoylpentapeptide beta-N-acetylglucosaminyltransferase [Rhodovibrio salinarum]
MTKRTPTRVLLAAGGTGGHMFPAAALARELLSRGLQPVLVTDQRAGGFGPELAEQVETHHIKAAGFAGGDLFAKLRSIAQLAIGYLQARRIVARTNPAVTVAFGGYAALPTGLAAGHKGVRLVLHEQNAVLGRANRMLASRADAIATSFPEVQGIGEEVQSRVVLTGNPVRETIQAIGRKPAVVADDNGPLRLLVTGGSQGARVFNELVPDAVARLPESTRKRLRITQQVRGSDTSDVRAAYEAAGVTAELKTFFDDLPERLAKAHLLICRSGASTTTELAAAGRPAILVPYPFAADDHQTANAQALAQAGGGWLMPQNTLTPEALAERLQSLFETPALLTRAAAGALSFAQTDSAKRLADLALDGRSDDATGPTTTGKKEAAA